MKPKYQATGAVLVLATNKDMKYVLIWLIYEFIRGKFVKLWYYLLSKM